MIPNIAQNVRSEMVGSTKQGMWVLNWVGGNDDANRLAKVVSLSGRSVRSSGGGHGEFEVK